ncbi:MAG: flavodoxin [Clostridia bacterium]|nr:flavodoxin [Clostridia bacterium]
MRTYRKQVFAVLLAGVIALGAIGCAGTAAKPEENASPTQATAQPTETPQAEASTQAPTAEGSKEEASTEPASQATDTPKAEEPELHSDILVVYFSRTGEQYQVGVIEKGNTAIVAEMIAEKTGADLFEILPVDDHYPMTYNELTDVAKREQNDNARPAYAGEVPDLKQYSTIFIGAPVWWGDWPMICYTFFETNADALSGKTLVPFSTHAGSGLSGFDRKLSNALPNSTVQKGLALAGTDCQNSPDRVQKSVGDWLNGLGF